MARKSRKINKNNSEKSALFNKNDFLSPTFIIKFLCVRKTIIFVYFYIKKNKKNRPEYKYQITTAIATGNFNNFHFHNKIIM